MRRYTKTVVNITKDGRRERHIGNDKIPECNSREIEVVIDTNKKSNQEYKKLGCSLFFNYLCGR